MRHVRKYKAPSKSTGSATPTRVDGNVEPVSASQPRRNVVGALFDHLRKWHPEKLANAKPLKCEA